MPYHTIPNELIDAGMEATTSAGADVSMIGQLAPVFAFIIVFVLAFALIKKSKILGEHVIFDLLISFIIAIVFASVTGVREIVLSVIPWFAVLLIALFFVLILTTFACADDVPKKFLVWLFLILMIVVFLIAGIKVFAGPGSPEAIPGMQQSMLQSAPPSENIPITQEYPPTFATQEEYGQYQGYEPGYEYQPYESYEYQGGISPDTITEISEQVVSERISELRKHLEKVVDFKTTMEAKTESIEERLKRIEKIIDTLQSSVLRKVGDYVTNIEDIKKELIETQKSFTKLVPEMKKHSRKTTTRKRKTTKRKKK